MIKNNNTSVTIMYNSLILDGLYVYKNSKIVIFTGPHLEDGKKGKCPRANNIFEVPNKKN